MPTMLSALAPVFLLIMLGYGLKRARVFPQSLWDGIEALVYWLLLPALLIVKLGNTDLSGFDVLPMTLAMVGATLLVVLGIMVFRLVVPTSGPVHTSILQGAVRQNSYIGIAAAAPLYGASGQGLAAIGIAAIIPLVNVISMWSLARLGPGGPPSIWVILKRFVTSPIIVACAIGIAANLTGVGLFDLAATTLEMLGRGAAPLGLLAVGAGLNFETVKRSPVPLIYSNVLRLLAMPVLTALLCHLQDIDPLTSSVAVLFASLPSSASSYVMARQFGGDHELMAAILTTQVIIAGVTIPLMLTLFGQPRL